MILSNIIENKYVFFVISMFQKWNHIFFLFEQSGMFNLIHDLNLPDRLSGTTGTSDATWKALERNFEKV